MFNNYLFDLDGTLTDPALGITNAVMYSLEKMNIEVPQREELYKFIGPPIRDAYKDYFGLSVEDAEKAVKYYREYYAKQGAYENVVYDEIPYVLDELKKKNKKLVVATSKPEPFALEILKHFGLYDFFDAVFGATMNAERVTKTDIIAYALKEMSIDDKKSTIMIGDRAHDIDGAKDNGVFSAAVTYGYGTKEEIEGCGPDFIIECAKDILNLQ